MIRHLKISEVGIMVENAQRFFDEGKMPGGLRPEVFTKNWVDYISSGRGVVFGMFGPDGKFHGALGALFYNDPFNGDAVATEQFWYIAPEFRGRGVLLLDAFCGYASGRGCKRVMMIHLEALQPEALKALYERRGFSHVETSYVKELQ